MENTEGMSNIKEQDIECSEEQQMEINTAEEAEKTVTPAHPYQDKLSQFQPHTWQLEEKEPQMYSSLDDTKFTLVDSHRLLVRMMIKLKKVTELAIAVERNSYRSFYGMVCHLQISTRTEDFLIDVLVLKDDLEVLNEVCTDSNILKVMHVSGPRDIKWLQKDFGIYLINMFDTQKAAKALKEEGASSPSTSLSNILKKYCDIVVNNEHEKADWRVRPLPDDMVKYARENAHFLLYLHDIFRNSLLKINALEDMYKACTDMCGSLWDPNKQVLRPDSYMDGDKKYKAKLNIKQLECFRLLYEWRYNISKENDESTRYTLPNKMMMDISRALPKEAQGIVKCCNPVPPFVEQNLEDVHKLVLQAMKNVPAVPKELFKKAQILAIKKIAIKNSKKKKKNLVKHSTTTTTTTATTANNKTCYSCGHRGHLAKDCVNQNKAKRVAKLSGGMRPPVRGGATWNGGRGAPFGAYPPCGPWMRGGPGFRGRGPRPMGPMHMYPYGHLPPHHPLGGDIYDGPFNNPYNQHGPRFSAGCYR